MTVSVWHMGTENAGKELISAARVTELAGPSAVRIGLVPRGALGSIAVRVAFGGIAMPDVLLSKGQYQDRPPLPFTLGCEFAGSVESSKDSRFPIGSRVAGILPYGAFAEVIHVDAANLLPVPDAVPLELAAALPINYLTMHYALHARGRISAGDRVLVRGGAGGIGIAAIQLARAAGASTIAAIASTKGKRKLALTEGADVAVGSPLELAETDGFDIVVDPVGGEDAVAAFRTVRQHGRYLIIGFAGGVIPTIAFNRVLLRNADLIGIYLGFRRQIAPEEISAMWADVCALAIDGAISPVIDSIHPLADVVPALEVVDQRRARGKVLLRISPE